MKPPGAYSPPRRARFGAPNLHPHLPTRISSHFIELSDKQLLKLCCLQNDGTGRQRLQFVAVSGGYNILLPAGRETCTQPNYVTAQTCATGTAVTYGAAGAGLQVSAFRQTTL